MSIIISLKETRKNIEQSLVSINEGEPLSKQIRFQHVHTLNKIIYIQACRLSHYAGLGMLSGNTLNVADIACNKPKVYLAKSCQVTSKTIQNHIKRLEEKELVKRVNKDGKLLLIVNPILLSISPNFKHILSILCENFKNLNSQENNSLCFDKEKTFPVNNPSGNNKSIITKHVEKLKNESLRDEKIIQEICQETQKTKQKKDNSCEKTVAKPQTLSDYQKNRKQKQGGRAENLAIQQKQFIQKQVMILWLWCMEHLYANRNFMSDSQQEYALSFFTVSFEGKQGAEIYHHISELRTRLGKWERFVNKASTIKRFTPLPTTFFNPDNSNGFVKTIHWLKASKRKENYNKTWKKARQIERIAAQILAGYYPEKKKNPINQRIEIHYRPLTNREKLDALQKLEYRVNRLSEKFPSINKWYRQKLQEIINKVATKKVA